MPSPAPKRILVTRSRRQTSDLAAQLRAFGAEPILIPTISIAPPESLDALHTALTELQIFDWIVFTSSNAVEAFANQLSLVNQSSGRPEVKVAAIGPTTAQTLTSIGLTPDLIPPRAVAESLAEAILPHITPGQTRILLVRAETARDVLPETLRAAGADLTIAPAYRNLIPTSSIPLLHALFDQPASWPDAITFTSSSTAANLLALLEAAHLTLPHDGAHGRTILRASIGPITSRTLRDLGYPPHLQAPEANIRSLVEALAQSLHFRAL